MDIIILIVIVSLLVVILFLALKKLIESITKDSKEYYFKKMQDYDEELYKKEKELEALNQIPKENEEYDEKDNKRVVEKNSIDEDLINIINETDYESNNILKISNKVDEIFRIDEEKILKEFIKKISSDEDYKKLQMLQDRFSPNLIYKLKMLNKSAQIKAINNLISDEEYKIFDLYLKTHNFKIEKFLIDLDLLIEENLPKIEVLVGSKNKNYDYLSPYIKTTYSDDIYKGMIIKYQDKIYDYSINERDV